MAWIYLTVAELLEVGWAIGLKYTDGFTRLLPSLWTITSMVLSIVLLGLALKTLPVGTAYAVWTGIGAVGTAALGIYLFAEPATALRLICIGRSSPASSVSSWSHRLRATNYLNCVLPLLQACHCNMTQRLSNLGLCSKRGPRRIPGR